MNKVVRLRLLSVLAIGIGAGVFIVHPVRSLPLQANVGASPQTRHGENPPSTAIPEFDNYRSWARVNTTPQYIMSKLDLLCVGPSPAQIAAEKLDPHVRHYMLCYVNKIGEQAMLTQKSPRFPVGSVVLKEKLDSPKVDAKRTLITAMVKHAPGYDPQHGDWEYIVAKCSNVSNVSNIANGDGATLQSRGKLANCGACHAEKRRTDFVFRDELGAERLAQLR